MDDWLNMSAADLGRGIEAGQIDPRDLTETYLSAIASHPCAGRIYARLTEDRARSEAAAAADRAKRSIRHGPLDGVPISWKDLFDTAGTATESGSAFLKGRIPERDARVLTYATQAGLVCLGKTHQTELAFSGLGLNPVTASPPCVNDHDAVPGGSSSGAATSVAFGLAATGIGSDTGGSVRIPAVWNDLVGLKTRHGRLSLDGVVPLCGRFDTVGPLCRSVEDAALMLGVLENSKPADLAGMTLKGARFAILDNCAFDGIEDAPRTAFENAVERMASSGATFRRVDLPAVAQAMALAGVLYAPEAYATWRDKIEAQGDLMYPPVRKRFLSGKEALASDYIAAWRELDCLRLMYLEAVAGFDAVLLPSCLTLPPKAQPLLDDEDAFTSANLKALNNTRIGNLMGLAAITLPAGVPSTGVMMQGPSEERLLRLAAAAEVVLG